MLSSAPNRRVGEEEREGEQERGREGRRGEERRGYKRGQLWSALGMFGTMEVLYVTHQRRE